MGEHDIANHVDERKLQDFTRAILCDLQALEKMLVEGTLENGIQRIGAGCPAFE